LFPVPECPGWVGCAVVCCLPVPVQLSLF
jgi:hypothetical protein